jgi:hypothetical protein
MVLPEHSSGAAEFVDRRNNHCGLKSNPQHGLSFPKQREGLLDLG